MNYIVDGGWSGILIVWFFPLSLLLFHPHLFSLLFNLNVYANHCLFIVFNTRCENDDNAACLNSHVIVPSIILMI